MIEIVKFKKLKNNLYVITLKDNTAIKLYDDTIIYFNLLVNKKIDDKKLKEIVNYNNEIEAYYKAIKYINIKFRTKQEIRKYLLRHNYLEKQVDNVIVRLEQEKYLDDDTYIKAYINDQIYLTLKGPKLIKKELERLGFNSEKINNYLTCYTRDIEEEKINKTITKKIKSNHNLSIRVLKEKIKQYLIRQGFALEVVKYCLSKIEFVESNDILKKEYEKEKRKLSKKYQGEELTYRLRSSLYRKGFEMSIIDNFLSSDNDK